MLWGKQILCQLFLCEDDELSIFVIIEKKRDNPIANHTTKVCKELKIKVYLLKTLKL